MRMSLTKRWWMLPAGIALAVGLYAALGFWGVPALIRSQAAAYADEELHRPLSLGEIRFNPFTLRFEANDIRLEEGGRPLVALKGLVADLQASSLWRNGYVLREVHIERPYLRAVVRADGSLNLADLLPESDPSSPPPEVLVEDFVVRGGRIDFVDQSRSRKPEKTLAPIEFALRDFRTAGDGGRFVLDAASEQGERFGWKGRLSLRPLASDGEFKVQALRARSVHEFFAEELPMELRDGQFDLAGRYVFSSAANGMQLEVALNQAQASSLALRARGMDDDWVVLPKAALDNARLSLAQHSLRADALRLDGVSAKVWREADGSVNLQRMFVPGDAPVVGVAAKNSISPARPEWSVGLGRLTVGEGNIEFEDRAIRPAARFHLSALSVELRDLSLDLTRSIPLTLQARVNGTAPLSVQGSMIPDSAAADLQFELGALPLRDVLSYLPSYPTLALKSGDVEAKGRLSLPAGGAMRFDGDAAISKFDLVERAGNREFLSWDRLDASGIDYADAPASVTIRQIRLRKPFAEVVIAEDQTVNLVNVLAEPEGSAMSAKIAPEAKPLSLKIGKVLLEQGAMGFADHSIEPNFAARIDGLRGSVSGLSTATDSVADIDLAGYVINKYSPVSIRGGTQPLSFDRHTDIQMAFRNIDLPLFNPYSGRFAGYAIAKGKLTTELHYQIEQRRLQASHHVVLDQLEWGQATDSKDKVSLPIRLATSLLKDRHGVIDLNLPVTGTLDDPKFRIGPVVWQIIKNILTKAATAPFSFLGSLFQGAEEAQFVDFRPGSADLDPAARERLAALAKGLVDRPALRLDIPAGAPPAVDADAVARQKMLQATASLKPKLADIDLDALDLEDRIDLLGDLYRQQFGSKPEFPEAAEPPEGADRGEKKALREQARLDWLQSALLQRFQPSAGDLQALSRARADAIQGALLGGGELDPTRVFISTNRTGVEHEGQVRVELGLE